MRSMRAAAGQYLALQAPMSLRDVGAQVGRPTGTTGDLMYRLDQHQARWESGSLTPSSVKGSASLTLYSDGAYRYAGHVHENGAFGHNWALAAGPAFLDPDGNAFVFAESGKVTDSSSSDDFEVLGHDPRIAQHWEQLRTSTISFHLRVDLNVGAVIELVLKVIGTIVGVAGAIALIHFIGGPGKMRVHRGSDGVDHVYREWPTQQPTPRE